MFETKEQYDAMLNSLGSPEEKQAFILENGDGVDLPTQQQLSDQQAQQQQAEIENAAVQSALAGIPLATPGMVDKVARLARGIGSVTKGIAAAPRDTAYWLATQFLPEEDIDTPEERQALMQAVGTMTKTMGGVGGAGAAAMEGLELAGEFLEEESQPFIKPREHGDFIEAFEEGEILEGADMLVGDVIEALPSVGLAFAGPGGLAAIGASAFGNKFDQEFEKNPMESANKLFFNAASTAGGEILTEMFTAGLGKGIGSLASKLGPRAAKAITANAVNKLVFGITGESLSEGAADTWERVSDYAILGDQKAFEGGWRSFAQNAIIGGIIGGGITTAQLGQPTGNPKQDAKNAAKKSVIENAVMPSKIKESRTEAGKKLNQLTAEYQRLMQEGASPEALDAISEQMISVQDAIDKSTESISKQVEKFDNAELKELSTINNELAALDEILGDTQLQESAPLAQEELTKKKEELINKQEEIFSNPVGEDAARANPVTAKGKKLAAATEKAFAAGDYASVLKNQAGTIQNVARKYWTKIMDVPKIDNDFNNFKKRFESEVADIMKNYNPEKAAQTGTNLAAKINKELNQRGNRIIGEFTVKERTTSIPQEDSDTGRGGIVDTEAAPERSTIEVVNEFKGIPEQTLNDAYKAAEHFELGLENVKNPRDYGKQQKDFFTKRLFTDLKKGLKKDYEGFVNSNAHLIRELIEGLPYSQKSSIVKEWAYSNPTPKQIADYFKGVDTVTNPENFSKPANERGNRKNTLMKAMAEAIGTKAWNEYVEANPEVQAEVNRINNIKAHLIDSDVTGATAGDFDFNQFQETLDSAENDFEAQSMHSDKVIENTFGKEAGKTFDTKNEKGFADMRDWVENEATKYFPQEFFTQGMFANAGQGGAKRGFAYLSKQDIVDNVHSRTKSEPTFKVDGKTYKWEDVKRYHYAKKTPAELKADAPIIQKHNDANMAALKYMYKKFEQMIKDNPANAKGVAAILKSAQNSQNHLSRIAAPLRAYENDLSSGTVEEHTMPQSAVARYMFQAAVNGQVDQAFPNIEKNFFQVLLSKNSDKALKGTNPITGEKFNYTSKMPVGWRPTDNAWARYFNQNIIQTNGGIDPYGITMLDGRSVADVYGKSKSKIAAQLKAPSNQGKRTGAGFTFTEDLVGKRTGAEFDWNWSPKNKTLDEQFAKIKESWGIKEQRYQDSTLKKIDDLARKVQGMFPKTDAEHIELMKLNRELANMRDMYNTGKAALNLQIADNVKDTNPAKIEDGLQWEYDKSRLHAEAHLAGEKDASWNWKSDGTFKNIRTEGVRDFLGEAWKRFGVNTITDWNQMRSLLEADGYKDGQITELYARTNGFAHYSNNKVVSIFINPKHATPETPIHEFGHIWNTIMQEKAPTIFNALIDKIKTEAPDVYAEQVKRVTEGYGMDPNTPEGMDEIMAGVIGQHGQMKLEKTFDKGSMKSLFEDVIKPYWEYLKQILGFDPKGKNMQDLTVGEMMDLVVDEVVNAAPGTQLRQLAPESFVTKSLQSRSQSVRMSLKPTYKGLTELQNAYKETGDLSRAMLKAYESVKNDWIDFDQFADFVDNTMKRAKEADLFSSPEIILNNAELISARLQEAQDAKLAQEVAKKDEIRTRTFKSKIDGILSRATGKPSKFTIPPNAEDFQGLLYTLVGKGEQGKKDLDFLRTNLIDAYNNGLSSMYQVQNKKIKSFKDSVKELGMDLNARALENTSTKYSIGDAIRIFNGTKVDGMPRQIANALKAKVEGNKKLKQFAHIAKEYNLGTDADYIGKPLSREIFDTINKDTRAEVLAPFIQNSKAIFNKETMKQIEKQFGYDYRSALDNMLQRMKSGKNRLSTEPISPFQKWLQRAVSTTMFWNGRSAVLQTLSSLNYVGLPNNNFAQAATGFSMKTFGELYNSPYLKERRNDSRFDVLAEDIATGKDTKMDRFFNSLFGGKYGGFSLTKAVDSFAIAFGGASFVNNRTKGLVKEGMTQEQAKAQAIQEWINASESSQQSSDPSKISQLQATDSGKLFFAFANTPFQYARIAKRKLQDIANGRSKNPAKDFGTAFYYTAGQTALFTTLQTGLVAAAMGQFGDDGDDEVFWDKMEMALDRGLTSLVKSMGWGGAGLATAYTVGKEMEAQINGKKRKDPAAVAKAFLGASPQVSVKVNQLEGIMRELNKKKPDYIKAATRSGEFAFALPFDRLRRKFENVQAAIEMQEHSMEKYMRFMGWSEWDFKPSFGKARKKKGKSFIDFDKEFKFDFDSPVKKLSNGEAGQAHNDGTIEVDPNLSPLEKAKTIKHEKEHLKQMQEDGLDYDDNYVYYKGNKHKRSHGRIRYNNKWHKEGDPKLPWEAEAYKAEKDVKSPLKQTGHDHDKKKEAEAEKRKLSREHAAKGYYADKSIEDIRFIPMQEANRGTVELGGTHYRPAFVGSTGDFEEHEGGPEHFHAAKDWSKAWNENPITLQKDIETTGVDENQYWHDLERQQKAQYTTEAMMDAYGDKNTATGATYDPETHTIKDNSNFKGAVGFSPESGAAHEFAHAGRDLERGLVMKDIVPEIKIPKFDDPDGEYQDYVNRPHELYGFLQQLRHSEGLKPGDELTEDMIKKAKEAGSENPLIKYADPKQIIEANRKVADVSKKQKLSLQDLYNNNQDNYYT